MSQQTESESQSFSTDVTQDDSARGQNSRKVKIKEKTTNHREGHWESNQAETTSQSPGNLEAQKDPRVLTAVSLQFFITANA